MLVPMVLEQTKHGERSYDIYSKLLKDRIIFVNEINSQTADLIVAQLIFLENDDSKKDIIMYISSPGGSITAGLAIYDTMNFIKPDVQTVCMGQAASMGAFLLSSGTKGKRFALPNSEVMIHQPLIGGGGLSGQSTDIEIQSNHLKNMKIRLNKILSENTGKSVKTIEKDTDRDTYLTAEKAKEYGLIDEIIIKR